MCRVMTAFWLGIGVGTGGTAPSKWTGSGAILAEFNETETPVQFGQCWVFSGVLTTRKVLF